MKPSEAIALADEMKPNFMSTAAKYAFLNEIEGMVYIELIMTHEPEGERKGGRFYAKIYKMISRELLMQNLHEKSDIVNFINTIRGKFHEHILRVQARLSEEEFTFMTGMEETLENEVQISDEESKADLIDFLEEVQEAIASRAAVYQGQPVYTQPAEESASDSGSNEGSGSQESSETEEEEEEEPDMLIPSPYNMFYVYWLMTKIDQLNQEMEKYNNDRALFENAYQQAADWYNRTHMPVQEIREFLI